MSRRKPSYTRLCLAARAIHETYYSLLRDPSWKANDEIKLIRMDPLNAEFLDRVIIELAATFDFPDAISLKYYIANQLKIPEKRRVAVPKMRPVVRQKHVNGKSAKQVLDNMLLGKRRYNIEYPGLYEPMAQLLDSNDRISQFLIEDPELVWA